MTSTFLKILILTIIYLTTISTSEPCPKVFNLVKQENVLKIHLTLPFPKQSSIIYINLVLNSYYDLQNNQLKLNKNESIVISEILNKKINYLELELTLPSIEPLPSLSFVSVNQIIICKGPLMITKFDTKIKSLSYNYVLNIPRYNDTRCDNSVNEKNNCINTNNNIDDSSDIDNIDKLRDYVENATSIDLRINQPRNLQCQFVRKGSYPWIVAVYIKSTLGIQYHCVANLISSNYVILAAHCLRESRNTFISAEKLILFFGKTKLDTWSDSIQSREVSEVNIHPNFDHLTYQSDIAVLRLNNAVQFNDNIYPICLYKKEHFMSNIGMVVGWGMNPKINNFKPNALRAALLKLIPWEICIQDRDFFYITSDSTLCARSIDMTGPCNGDSGAGFVIYNSKTNQWYLKALVSLAMLNDNTQHCDLSRSVVLTNVEKYMSWVEQIISK